jgi:rhodanese-related sulfurtransferase
MNYESKTMRILGFQAAGAGEVTRYIDVVSALLPKQATALDLIELEHAYTPPHASPLSPLNHLGAMIIAQEEDHIQSISPDIVKITGGSLLDVRTDDEVQDSPLEFDVIHIPQDQLRQRKAELDSTKPIHIICRRGPRSLEAVRFLKNQDVEQVDYVGGGTAMILTKADDEA